MVIELVIEASSGSTVVAYDAPRLDSLDICDCRAAISAETVEFSQRLRMSFNASSAADSVPIPPFSIAYVVTHDWHKPQFCIKDEF